MAEWIIAPLAGAHVRGAFSCGKPSLDEFLQLLATQYAKRGLGRTYVATLAGENKVCGYYSLASSSVAFQYLPATSAKKLPKHPVPVVLLGRLAVDKPSQGLGLGAVLLRNAFLHCFELSKQIGINAVEVSALDLDAKQFYAKFGFEELLDDPCHLFLSMKTIERSMQIKP